MWTGREISQRSLDDIWLVYVFNRDAHTMSTLLAQGCETEEEAEVIVQRYLMDDEDIPLEEVNKRYDFMEIMPLVTGKKAGLVEQVIFLSEGYPLA